jgi:hypothetical protein
MKVDRIYPYIRGAGEHDSFALFEFIGSLRNLFTLHRDRLFSGHIMLR